MSQVLESVCGSRSVIDRLEKPGPEVVSKLYGISLIALIADRARMLGITDQEFGDERMSQVKEPLRERAFFKSEVDAAAYAAKEIANGHSISLDDGLSHEFPVEVKNGNRNGCFVNVESNILDVGHSRLLWLGWFIDSPKLSQGAIFQDTCYAAHLKHSATLWPDHASLAEGVASPPRSTEALGDIWALGELPRLAVLVVLVSERAIVPHKGYYLAAEACWVKAPPDDAAFSLLNRLR
jgi:hypothetical protein